MEFWLSTDATPAKQTTPTEAAAAATTTEDTPTKTSSKKRSKKKGGAKAEPTPEITPVVSAVMDEPEPGEGGEGGEAEEAREEEGKRRKKKGEKVSQDFALTRLILINKKLSLSEILQSCQIVLCYVHVQINVYISV